LVGRISGGNGLILKGAFVPGVACFLVALFATIVNLGACTVELIRKDYEACRFLVKGVLGTGTCGIEYCLISHSTAWELRGLRPGLID
jgi:hypothetical protein